MQGIVTIAEIEQKHPDEWVLVEITRYHREHWRVRGRLLAHSTDRAEVDKAYWRFRAEHPGARLFQFYTGDVVAEGVTVVL